MWLAIAGVVLVLNDRGKLLPLATPIMTVGTGCSGPAELTDAGWPSYWPLHQRPRSQNIEPLFCSPRIRVCPALPH